MKRIYLLATALAAMTMASCSDDNFVGDNSPTNSDDNGTEAIVFNSMRKESPVRVNL